MAYEPHTYVTFSGTLSEQTSQDEIWQIGIRGFNPTGGKSPVAASELQNLVDAIFADIGDWYSANDGDIFGGAFLREIKAVNIGADGKYSSQPRTHAVNLGGGRGDTPGLPTFNSIVYSWTTGVRTGKAAHGRVYPPNFWLKFQPGLATLQVASQATALTQAARLLNVVSQSGPQFVFRPYVVSSSGVSRAITGVRVGNVIDVQRRRKNAVPETYTSAAWNPPA